MIGWIEWVDKVDRACKKVYFGTSDAAFLRFKVVWSNVLVDY